MLNLKSIVFLFSILLGLSQIASSEYSRNSLHGPIGLYDDLTPLWKSAKVPDPISDDKLLRELVRGGGMYVNMSDSVSLNRDVNEQRDSVCIGLNYELSRYSNLNATVIITFHEEWMSTLLRSVHSVLNRTPPEILHEILLIDDASTKEWLKSPLDEYVKYLPKVKLIRLPHRHGVVRARLAGAKAASGKTIVVLDSHIEVSHQWLEPLLEVLAEKPKAIVTPQIDSIISTDFSFTRNEGIGCYLGLKFTMVEEAHLSQVYHSTDPIKSPIMAGGLWAARRDWFFELGGYDSEMDVWGAEHIEMSFRTWMCGGQVLCAPCSRVFHVFRRGSDLGYSIPLESIWKNRLRAAASWMGPYAEIAEAYNHHPHVELGTFDHVWKLQEKLSCKRDFTWYIDNVLNDSDIKNMDDVLGLGEILSVGGSFQAQSHLCIDLRGSRENKPRNVGLYPCYHLEIAGRGQQGFMLLKTLKEIRLVHLLVTDHERLCFAPPNGILECSRSRRFSFDELSAIEFDKWNDKNTLTNSFGARYGIDHYRFMRIRWSTAGGSMFKCLSAPVTSVVNGHRAQQMDLQLSACNENDINQIFAVEKFPNKKWNRPLPSWEKQDAVNWNEAGEEIRDEL